MTKKVTERAMDTIDSLIVDLKKAGNKLGPKAVEAARGAVKVSAVNWIISGGISAVVAIGFAIFSWKLWHSPLDPSVTCAGVVDNSRWASDSCLHKAEDAVFTYRAFSLACLVPCSAALINVKSKLLDAWTWTALRNPDLWIADQVLDKLLDQDLSE